MSYVFNEQTGSESRNWYSICSNSVGDRLAAVVNGGQIYTSNDYGVTWVARDSARQWYSICSNSLGDRLAAVVYNGQIYTSSNYGETWTARDSVRQWYSICSNSVGDRLAAVVYNGQIYTSSDYGETWTPRDSVRYWVSICSNSVGDRLAAVQYTFDGQIYTSSDYGVTWTLRNSTPYWYSICSNSVGDRLAAVVKNGQIYTSNDYGVTWVARDSARQWYSICSNSLGDRLAAVVKNGQIYTSSNYGETWTARDSVRQWYSICSNSTGYRLAAVVYSGRIYTAGVYYTYKNIILEDMLEAGTSTTLTGYQINGTDMKFLKAFYKGTDKDAVTDLSPIMDMFTIAGSNPGVCPLYALLPNTGTGFPIPSGITKMFVVCIGGGGGGGGGGCEKPGFTGGGGGGGGGGALNAWFVTVVSGQTTYNVTIGGGGLYGQANSSGTVNGVVEGGEDGAGNYSEGRGGDDGGDTTFTYNSNNYISNGGKGGKGGIGGDPVAGTGAGGAGGAVSTTPTPVYGSLAGSNGVKGGYTDTLKPAIINPPANAVWLQNDYYKEGGKGGASGNKRGTDTRFLINNSYINVQPFTPYTNPNTSCPSYDTYNNDRICYGDGGQGGIGEGNGYGSGGYSGLKGCVIVFFYY